MDKGYVTGITFGNWNIQLWSNWQVEFTRTDFSLTAKWVLRLGFVDIWRLK